MTDKELLDYARYVLTRLLAKCDRRESTEGIEYELKDLLNRLNENV